MVRVTENSLEPQGKERGLFNYLWEQVLFMVYIYNCIQAGYNK